MVSRRCSRSASAVVTIRARPVAGAGHGRSRSRRRPVVVTTGQATVRLPPDRAYLTLSTETRAPKPAEAQQRNAQAMAAVQQKLEAARLPKESVRTLAYSLEEEFDYVEQSAHARRGFRAVNTIEVRLDDITRVGEILDLAVGGRRHERAQHPLRPEGARGGRTPGAAACRCRRARARRGGRGRRERDAGGRHAHRGTGQGNARAAPDDGDDARDRRRRRRWKRPVTAGEIEIEATVLLTATIK